MKHLALVVMAALLTPFAFAETVDAYLVKQGKTNCDGYCSSYYYSDIKIFGRSVDAVKYCANGADLWTITGQKSLARNPFHDLKKNGQTTIRSVGLFHRVCIELWSNGQKVKTIEKLEYQPD